MDPAGAEVDTFPVSAEVVTPPDKPPMDVMLTAFPDWIVRSLSETRYWGSGPYILRPFSTCSDPSPRVLAWMRRDPSMRDVKF